jgi:hypothetical protein
VADEQRKQVEADSERIGHEAAECKVIYYYVIMVLCYYFVMLFFYYVIDFLSPPSMPYVLCRICLLLSYCLLIPFSYLLTVF